MKLSGRLGSPLLLATTRVASASGRLTQHSPGHQLVVDSFDLEAGGQDFPSCSHLLLCVMLFCRGSRFVGHNGWRLYGHAGPSVLPARRAAWLCDGREGSPTLTRSISRASKWGRHVGADALEHELLFLSSLSFGVASPERLGQSRAAPRQVPHASWNIAGTMAPSMDA